MQQKGKVKIKLNILQNVINSLLDYNTIEEYDNLKAFNIDMDYYYNKEDNSYEYIFKIFKGYNREVISEFHISSKNKINKFLVKLIESLITDQRLLLTSFNKNKRIYSIIFSNKVSVTFHIKDNNDKKFYESIDNQVVLKVIELDNKIKAKDDRKDVIDMDKAGKIIKLVSILLNGLIKYNSVEKINNIKNYKLIIDITYDEKHERYRYIFKINDVTKSNFTKTIFEMNATIYNNNLYSKFYDLIMECLENNEFLYKFSTVRLNKDIFGIKFKNNVDLYFYYNDSKSKLFFDQFQNDKVFEEKRILEKKI